MFVRYATIVSFLSLCAAYIAALFVGWSLAGSIPWLTPDEQVVTLARSVAVFIVTVPIWLLHWYWTQRDWDWTSNTAQYYLAFFTVIGLGVTMFVGAQFITRVLELLLGVPMTHDPFGFLFGAFWSTAVSAFMWLYHGWLWIRHRRLRKAAVMALPTELPPDAPAETIQ